MRRVARSLVFVGAAAWSLACARDVDDACRAYKDCQAAYDAAAGLPAADTSRYDENGDCWAGDPKTRDRCIAECEESRAAVAAAAANAGLVVDACAAEDDVDAADADDGAAP